LPCEDWKGKLEVARLIYRFG
jgi:hypothetical protein